jgi:hypothetical protein
MDGVPRNRPVTGFAFAFRDDFFWGADARVAVPLEELQS